jgi:hypothetical protein
VSAPQAEGQPAQRAPFQPLAPAVAVALAYGAGALIWLAVGQQFNVGRWLALHLFTLGVLSNLVMAMADHFARTLLHSPVGHGPRSRFILLNLGAVLVLAGLPTGQRMAVYLGPMVRGRSPARRTAMRERLQRHSAFRVIAFNAGLVLIVIAAITRHAASQPGSLVGWLLIALAVASSLWPLVPLAERGSR